MVTVPPSSGSVRGQPLSCASTAAEGTATSSEKDQKKDKKRWFMAELLFGANPQCLHQAKNLCGLPDTHYMRVDMNTV